MSSLIQNQMDASLSSWIGHKYIQSSVSEFNADEFLLSYEASESEPDDDSLLLFASLLISMLEYISWLFSEDFYRDM